ncbi:thioredoxin domain-containing protein [Lacinutrix sp. Bg11-31]|uniref:thioredoxin domain-containing protein n=1 Tax=Lacinutrix sp. Bg11-31 TaxID=2057808 RepID=UPI000C305D65|nr:thioredoxin domain-containing protein [Lacinutrix sp. Bg11-31]AUC81762.1 thioredoxin domain-containing protein [Lacinutrix sp. Bg11-31]
MLNKIGGIVLIFVFFVSCSQQNKSDINKEVTNDLINETSPYLLQHAYNPVDWKAWNSETLKLAKEEGKLIVISVGYSACHWCHVMEEESFENDSVAKIMNENFINIKVDREERPDVDQIYMSAVQLMTGSGGWPLNCIALPDGRPVFGGTYFTKEQWTKILEDMSNLYKSNPEKVIAYANKLTEGIKNTNLITVNTDKVKYNKDALAQMVDAWKNALDFENGGQKNAPKFPMPSNLNFLLRYSFQNNDIELQKFVKTSLLKMANGGIYDQIGGGFSRYSIDEKWHVPHFEKMLYDNAQLVSLYSNAYQLTKNETFKTVVKETLEFIDKELTHENGAFYSSLDADSKTTEGVLEEGAFYVWTEEELKPLLKEDYELFKSYYNINSSAKWKKDNYILNKTMTNEAFLKTVDISKEDFITKLQNWKSKLYNERSKRERPRTDDKVLTSWNALMLKGYVDAYRALDDKSYLNKAIENGQFLKKNLIKEDGSLFHNYKNEKSTIIGFSEDYAHTISAFIELYQATLDEDWLHTAKNLLDYAIKHYLNKESEMFYFTSDTQTDLITRKTEVIDKVIPSSNSVLAKSLFKLGHYYSDKKYTDRSKQMLNNIIVDAEKAPSGYSNWLGLYLNCSNPYYEVAISGKEALLKLKKINEYYLPNILIAGAVKESKLPIMESRFNENNTYLYVCVDGSCKLPVKEVRNAVDQLLK